MSRAILAVDVGTTALKLGVYTAEMEKLAEATRRYDINVYGNGRADVDTDKWWKALEECCAEVRPQLAGVGVVSFSVTTPGLLPMGEDGAALGPAILFLDGRSHQQARAIRQAVGEDKFLAETCNLPVSGGSSLCSMLWIRDNQPEVFGATAKFGHTNTHVVKRLTGEWTIDPSTISITGLYNTAADDLTWNQDVLAAAKIPESKLPPIRESYECVGEILPEWAERLGLPKDCKVLCGGNDAVLSALSGGITSHGEINDVCGTCEIVSVCLSQPVASRNFNIRRHAIPGRWLTFFILNTGGKALEWFHSVFCRDMSADAFYEEFVPETLRKFFDSGAAEAELPGYEVFLGGSRYSTERLKAAFNSVCLETTREDMLISLIRGNAMYLGGHLHEVGSQVKLGRRVMTTGGGANIKGFLEVKKRWTGDFDYEYRDQSSLDGAAMLGQFYYTGRYADRNCVCG